jgi:hypothetical protein
MSSLFLVGRALMVVVCLGIATACGAETESVPDEPTETGTIDSASGSIDDGGASTGDTELTVEKVVAWIDSTYPDSTPVCDGTGRIDVGDVFACDGPVPTAQVERGAMVIYVLDESGRSAWSSGTDIPNSTDVLLADYGRAPKDLFCRDLLDPEVEAYPFGALSTPETNFFWSLVYWSLEGEPDRMDADQNGVPCETLYDPAVVDNVLAGGPVS